MSLNNAKNDAKNFAMSKKTNLCVLWDSLVRIFGMESW